MRVRRPHPQLEISTTICGSQERKCVTFGSLTHFSAGTAANITKYLGSDLGHYERWIYVRHGGGSSRRFFLIATFLRVGGTRTATREPDFFERAPPSGNY